MVISMAIPQATVRQASSVKEVLNEVPADIDIVLLDIKLNGSSGLEGIALIKRQWPEIPVLMLSSQDEPETARLALAQAGDKHDAAKVL